MDGLESFHTYYSNNNEDDKKIYLIDLKIMMTPTSLSNIDFHITLKNDENQVYSESSISCVKKFFEMELALFEKLNKLAIGFGQWHFDDLWSLFHQNNNIDYLNQQKYFFSHKKSPNVV
jgi:hypothetical protein